MTRSQEKTRDSQRVEWLDSLRGWGIALVVMGHTMLGLMAAGRLSADSWVQRVLLFDYALQVPILFFVSGVVSKDHTRPVGTFFRGQLKYVVYPYLLWSLILVTLQNAWPDGANSETEFSALLSVAWKPVSIYWFLYSLFIVKSLDYAASRLLSNRRRTPAVLMVLGAAWFEGLEIARLNGIAIPAVWRGTASALFFYGLGRLAAQHWSTVGHLASIAARRSSIRWIVTLVLLMAVASAVAVYEHLPARYLRAVSEAQPGILVTGTVGIAAFSLVSQHRPRSIMSRFITVLGQHSMPIYVMHTIVGATMRSLINELPEVETLVQLALITALGLVVPIVVQRFTDHLGMSSYLGLRPILVKGTMPPGRP